jgi:hypothetical protein
MDTMSRGYGEYIRVDDIPEEYIHMKEIENDYIHIDDYHEEIKAWETIAADLYEAVKCLQEVLEDKSECGPCQGAIQRYKEVADV